MANWRLRLNGEGAQTAARPSTTRGGDSAYENYVKLARNLEASETGGSDLMAKEHKPLLDPRPHLGGVSTYKTMLN